MTSALQDLQGLRANVDKIVDQVKAKVAGARKRLRDAGGKKNDFVRTHVPLADARARAERVVQAHGAAWLRDVAPRLFSPESAAGTGWHGLAGRGRGRHIRLPWNQFDPLPWAAICATEPERAVQMLVTMIERCPGYKPGPPEAQRLAQEADLEREIERLQADEEAAVDMAIEAGIAIEHRPEVVKRRAKEQEQARNADRIEAEAIARENAIDQRQAEEAPRVG